MSTITFRLAGPSDVPTIYLFDHLAAQGDAARREFIRHAVDQRTCTVAVLDGAIAGYAVLEYGFFGCGFISMIYVHSDYRRQGVGQGLLVVLEKACATPKLFTSTNLSNLPMQALLDRHGYLPSGVIHNLDEGDPELVYFKRLRPI
jgi:ribosomal protein S18 acetylase RimI-like enzyme